jgi:hypothetical protein
MDGWFTQLIVRHSRTERGSAQKAYAQRGDELAWGEPVEPVPFGPVKNKPLLCGNSRLSDHIQVIHPRFVS